MLWIAGQRCARVRGMLGCAEGLGAFAPAILPRADRVRRAQLWSRSSSNHLSLVPCKQEAPHTQQKDYQSNLH